MPNPIYVGLYDLVATYIFGEVAVGTYPELVCTLVATLGSIALIALPFVMVYWIASLIVRGFR